MMSKKSLCLTLICALLVWSVATRPSVAIPNFQKQFWALYLDDNDNKEFVTLVKKKVKCNVCHDPTKRDENGKPSKKFRNAYGQHLSKLLDKSKDKKNKEKIRAALEQVAKMKSDPKDPESPTFGELIQRGELPVQPPNSGPTTEGGETE